KLARIMYVSLYRLHQVALHGRFHTLLLMLIGRINKVVRPRLKLH
ncbi:MAG: FAD-dependent oxidoreductase, partial [Pseudomonadota bacterium]|nr:FAD-dependent oxidoreductase [Pseudomonadota bacterium]